MSMYFSINMNKRRVCRFLQEAYNLGAIIHAPMNTTHCTNYLVIVVWVHGKVSCLIKFGIGV